MLLCQRPLTLVALSFYTCSFQGIDWPRRWCQHVAVWSIWWRAHRSRLTWPYRTWKEDQMRSLRSLRSLGCWSASVSLKCLKALSTPATFPEKYPSPLEKLDVVSIDYMFLANLQGSIQKLVQEELDFLLSGSGHSDLTKSGWHHQELLYLFHSLQQCCRNFQFRFAQVQRL